MTRIFALALAFVSACAPAVEGEQKPRTGAFCSLSCVPVTDAAFFDGAVPTFETAFSRVEPLDCRYQTGGTECVYVEHLTCDECAAAALSELDSCEPRVIGEDGSVALTRQVKPVAAVCG